MKKEEFIDQITTLVERYIDNFDSFDSNPQLQVNPATLYATIVNGADMQTELGYDDEAIEEAAAADRPDEEDSDDKQAARNPDFYAVKQLIHPAATGGAAPLPDAIEEIAGFYAEKFS